MVRVVAIIVVSIAHFTVSQAAFSRVPIYFAILSNVKTEVDKAITIQVQSRGTRASVGTVAG